MPPPHFSTSAGVICGPRPEPPFLPMFAPRQAQRSVGVFFNQGRGVQQDDREAAKWFQIAAEQGYIRAQFNLGNMFADGRGVTQDSPEAIKWLRLAARGGYTEAQMNLARHYATCDHIKLDAVQAYKWFAIAADRVGPFQQDAMQGVAFLERRL